MGGMNGRNVVIVHIFSLTDHTVSFERMSILLVLIIISIISVVVVVGDRFIMRVVVDVVVVVVVVDVVIMIRMVVTNSVSAWVKRRGRGCQGILIVTGVGGGPGR